MKDTASTPTTEAPYVRANRESTEAFDRDNSQTTGWLPIQTAPRDGSEVLLYRPLAQKTNDPVVVIRKTTPYQHHVWSATVPPGCDGKNFTEGSCYATHWQPLPEPPL